MDFFNLWDIFLNKNYVKIHFYEMNFGEERGGGLLLMTHIKGVSKMTQYLFGLIPDTI